MVEEELDDLLDGMSRIEFMLRFTLSHPDLDTTIVGTANPAHLRQNLDAARKGPLPPDVLAEAKSAELLAAAKSQYQSSGAPRPVKLWQEK